VVVTVRSEEKGRSLLKTVDESRTSFVVVEDIAKDGAFDEVVQADPPFDYVVHTASPYHLSVQDPVRDFLDPAIKGTTGILKSVHKYAPTVKRVVFTSSSAAILYVKDHLPVYDESVFCPMTWEEAMEPENTYKGSKVRSMAC
jgi:nucleoside-diphosphate-sugar epimerase